VDLDRIRMWMWMPRASILLPPAARRPPRQTFSFLLRGLRLFFSPCLSYSCYVIPMQETCADEESIVSGSSPFQETVLYWVRTRNRLFQSDSRIVADDCLRIAGVHL
jgi:hypothetical protein